MNSNGGESWLDSLWRDLEQRAVNDALVYRALTLVRLGEYTREEAIARMITGLLDDRAQRYLEDLEALRNAPARPIVIQNRPAGW